MERGVGQIGPQTDVDERDAVVGQSLTAVGAFGVGRVGALAVEVLFVGVVEIRGDEEGELAFGFAVLDTFVGVLPEVVENGDDLFGIGEVGGFVDRIVEPLLLGACLDAFEEAVEGVEARSGRRVADPHRGADSLGDGLLEERGFGLLQLAARQVVHIDVGARRDFLVYQREVVGGRESQLGLHAAQSDGFLQFVGGAASGPPCGGVFLEDVALPFPELDGRRDGHVVEDPHAQFAGRRAAQDGTEEDVFEVGTGVLLGVF